MEGSNINHGQKGSNCKSLLLFQTVTPHLV